MSPGTGAWGCAVSATQWGEVIVGFLAGMGVQGLLSEVGLELNRRRVLRVIRSAQDGADQVRELLDQRAG
jgi:hypothetical protein